MLNFSFIFDPHLSLRCFRAILPLIVLFSNLIPISGKNSAATSLVTFDHSTSRVLVGSLIYLFEECIQRSIPLWLILGLLFCDLLVNFVPVFLVLEDDGYEGVCWTPFVVIGDAMVSGFTSTPFSRLIQLTFSIAFLRVRHIFLG